MVQDNSKVLELPILKHFSKGEISLNPQNWRKGEKGIASVMGLVIFGTIAWGLYQFILPIVFSFIISIKQCQSLCHCIFRAEFWKLCQNL